MNTCGKCLFYQGDTLTVTKPDGSTAAGGYCFGSPPTTVDNKSFYPSVRSEQPECALWRAPPTKRKTR